jgi:anaerobic selenocysteine-containing dehydrogenase
MDRRTFIKLTAVTGTTATLAACGNPENQLVRFVPDEDIVPGQAAWLPSVCPLCSAGCGLTVRVMDADADVTVGGQAGVKRIKAAKKLEGNPNHPVNRGRLCARGQSAIQVTYHPDRITQPLKLSGSRGQGQYAAISWDDALAEFVARLDALAAAGNQRTLAFLTRPGNSRRRALVEQFLTGFGAPPPIAFELFGDDVLRQANGISFGRSQLPTFDLGNARYVLSFGADFLGTWNSPVAHAVAYGEMRQGRPGVRGRMVQVEARMSQTGANADEWVPVNPGTEGVLALGIANAIMTANLRPAGAAGPAGAAIEGWSGGLTAYTPDEVQKLTGVDARRIQRLAREFAETGPAVAIVAGPPLAQTNGLFNALAVNALNALVGNVGQPGGVYFTPQLNLRGGQAAAAGDGFRLQPEGTGGTHIADAQVLCVDGANPVFTTPRAWGVRDALVKVPYIVSFGHFLDETSVLADLILPDHTFLEGWSDAVPESGSIQAVASVAPAVMRPLYQTRPSADVLLDVGRRLQQPIAGLPQTYEEALTNTFTALPSPNPDLGDAFAAAQTQGVWTGELPAAAQAPAATPARGLVGMAAPQFDGDAGQFPLHFLPYPSTQFLDGSLAHLPWLQEMPDPITSAMWSTWIEINPQTAAAASISDGDVVEITSAHGTVRAPAFVTPSIAPNMVAMPVGQGHTFFTRFATGRGSNPVDILAPSTESSTGAWAWAATRVRIARVGDADGSLILFAGGKTEHVEHER